MDGFIKNLNLCRHIKSEAKSRGHDDSLATRVGSILKKCSSLLPSSGRRATTPTKRKQELYVAKMEMEEPHENIIMIRGFPVSFPKVSNRRHGAYEKCKT